MPKTCALKRLLQSWAFTTHNSLQNHPPYFEKLCRFSFLTWVYNFFFNPNLLSNAWSFSAMVWPLVLVASNNPKLYCVWATNMHKWNWQQLQRCCGHPSTSKDQKLLPISILSRQVIHIIFFVFSTNLGRICFVKVLFERNTIHGHTCNVKHCSQTIFNYSMW